MLVDPLEKCALCGAGMQPLQVVSRFDTVASDLIWLAFGGCVPVSQTDTKGRQDNSPEGVKTRSKIETIQKQKVEGQAQLTAMRIHSMVGVVEPQIAIRQKDGLMEMMPGQQVPSGHVAEKTSAAFIPVNVPINVSQTRLNCSGNP